MPSPSARKGGPRPMTPVRPQRRDERGNIFRGYGTRFSNEDGMRGWTRCCGRATAKGPRARRFASPQSRALMARLSLPQGSMPDTYARANVARNDRCVYNLVRHYRTSRQCRGRSRLTNRPSLKNRLSIPKR